MVYTEFDIVHQSNHQSGINQSSLQESSYK